MKLRVKIFLIGIALGVLTLSGCSQGGGGDHEPSPPPPPTPKVLIAPASETLSPGTSFTWTIEVLDVGDTFYAAFDLTYDPSVVEYVDATEGSFLSQTGSDEISFQITLENGTPGRLTVGLTRLGPIGEVSGSGMLLTLSFKALGPGTTTMAFADPKALKDSAHADVSLDAWENSTITVQ